MIRVLLGFLPFLGILLTNGVAGHTIAGPPTDSLKLLFLGDNGLHRPGELAAQLVPKLAARGIDVKYTDDAGVLQPGTLAEFDGLIVYANIEKIEPSQLQALLDYVAHGGGFIPLHCASYCFLNAPEYVELVGAQFQRHGGEVFSTVIAEPEHPIMVGFGGFESWDETYVHHRHNPAGRTVLEYREQGTQAEGQSREPWTWIRKHGEGRVFYTAWGHDQRTWRHPGFQNLLERGIRWACGGDVSVVPPHAEVDRFVAPAMTTPRTDVAPFEYIDVGTKIPNYPAGSQWGAQDEPLFMMQLPLSADESLKHFVTPVDFEVRLFAAEPRLGAKPIAMNWDERGRLWVCESVDYPNNLQPPGVGRDRIEILEDTDRDGQADKVTLFAENLSIPTAILCCRGGAIVQNGTETLFLKDTDGDDHADVREVLISNWELGDTHGGVSNFRYGLDNWIWAMQGYNASTPRFDSEERQSFRMGFFRFRIDNSDPPRVTDLEFLRSTNNNTWGLGISEEGLIFGSTANRCPSVYLPIPNRYYERVRGWSPQQLEMISDSYLFQPITDKVRQVDHHGGYTAGAGHALYTARTYPRQWWNRTAFVCGPTGKLIGTFVLERDGTDVRSHSPCNLVASDDEWTAPILAEVGPDGNVWFIDWYNFIVQHNPTPRGFETGKGNAYDTDLRDKQHGRVYRVVAQDPETSADIQPLQTFSTEELVTTLAHPTMLWRLQAQRLLVERGDRQAIPALLERLEDSSTDELGLNPGVIHALWTLQGLEVVNASFPDVLAVVARTLEHPSAAVRRNALQVLPPVASTAQMIVERGLVNDTDPHVQLAALLALADAPAQETVGRALSHKLSDADMLADRWLPDGLTSACATNAATVLSLLAGDHATATAGDQVASLDPRARDIVIIVAEHFARVGPTDLEVNALLAALGAAHPDVVGAMLGGLSRGWSKDQTVQLDAEANRALFEVLERLPAEDKGQLIRLAMLWGSDELQNHAEEIAASLFDVVRASETPDAERIAAVDGLVGLRPDDSDVVSALLEEVTPQMSPELAGGILEGLSKSSAPELGEMLVERATGLTPAMRQVVLQVLLSRPATTAALLEGIAAGQLQLSELSLDQKQGLSGHPDRDLRRRARQLLEAGGGLPSPDRQRVLASLLPVTEQVGDATLGKAIFTKQCAKCHRHSGEGENIGPDLTGMAVHPKAELLTHIIDPSRSVEGNFRLYTVLTDEGRVFTGMLAAETLTTIELIDTEAKRHTILREEIEQLLASGKSLMPEGFENQMNSDELSNLLEFMTAKGRFLPLPLSKVATAISTRNLFTTGDGGTDRLIFDDWGPKEFAGIPFHLVDPRGDTQPNIILLNGPRGTLPPRMPRAVRLPVNAEVKSIHLLSGVGGWNFPAHQAESVSMTLRLHYQDGSVEDHELLNGRHFADYIRRVDVPESTFAFALRNAQIRYLSVSPDRPGMIRELELVKGNDPSAPIVVAITVETQQPPQAGE